MTRRICFDICCNYFIDRRHPWLDGPNDARRYLKNEPCRFSAASAYDESIQEYLDFTDFNEFFSYLLHADEIITFNGRKYDLVAIENLIGEESAMKIWSKTHHDLSGWTEWGLKDSINSCFPDKSADYSILFEKRKAELIGSGRDDATADALANTHRDVTFTYMLFKKYFESGDSKQTFLDDSKSLIPKNDL